MYVYVCVCAHAAFMRLLASVASEVEMDVFIPVAALGLLTRPRPVLKTLLVSFGDTHTHTHTHTHTQTHRNTYTHRHNQCSYTSMQ